METEAAQVRPRAVCVAAAQAVCVAALQAVCVAEWAVHVLAYVASSHRSLASVAAQAVCAAECRPVHAMALSQVHVSAA